MGEVEPLPQGRDEGWGKARGSLQSKCVLMGAGGPGGRVPSELSFSLSSYLIYHNAALDSELWAPWGPGTEELPNKWNEPHSNF